MVKILYHNGLPVGQPIKWFFEKGKSFTLERVGGIEPPFPLWKSGIITIIRYPLISTAKTQ